MTKRAEIKIALEKFLRTGDGRSTMGLMRDNRRRAILIPESLLDYDKITASGRSLSDYGRRIRLLSEDPKKEDQSYIVPTELCQISREEPQTVAGVVLPFGTVVNEGGLWVRFAPGYQELGINDRGEILIRRDAHAASDPARGPVRNAINTAVTAPAKRLVTRLDAGEHRADREEAEAWLHTLSLLGGEKTVRAEFKCAGIDFAHVGNVPHLNRTVRLNFFDVRDFEMVRIASLIRNKFHKLRREPPRVVVYSLAGVPGDQAGFAAFQKKVKSAKKDPAKLGLPSKLTESRFYDPASKGVPPASYMLFAPLAKTPDELAVITVNTDYHGEVRSRGVFSPLTAILSLIDVISARAGATVLNKKGTATLFTGPAGTGRTTAAVFWADRNEKYRRLELRRRYEIDLRRTPDAGRMGEAGIQKELDRVLSRVGILCQEGWIEVFKEGAGHWLFWPTERSLHARTSGFPGLRCILGENNPLLENVVADFGGSGRPSRLGRVTHGSPSERLYYDPDWKHLHYDRSPRMIASNVFLELTAGLDFLVRRVSAREAIDWLIEGRTPDGRFEPLHNPYPDFSGLLIQLGVVGEKLAAAYEKALKGDCSLLGAGDAKVGQAIFEKLDVQVKLWLDNCREVPTYILNGAAGLELTQDVTWLLSEYPATFGDWKRVTLADFQKHMKDRYGVTYGPSGEWEHIPASARRH